MVNNLKPIKILLDKILAGIDRGAKGSEAQMIPFGIFGLAVFFLYHLINLYLLPPALYESLWPRLAIGILCFFLILKNHWPQKIQRFLPIYWYVTLLYSIPFFITFMVFKNNGATAWVMNLLSIIMVMMLLVDWVSYTFLLTVGVLFAWIAYRVTTPTPFSYMPGTLTYSDIINTFSISIIMGIIFSRKKEKMEREKLEAVKLFSANITHELRTPLCTINAMADGVQEYLPDLMTAYQLAKQQNIPVPEISLLQFKSLAGSLDRIRAETGFANTIINMLLVNVDQTNVKLVEFDVCSITHCVEEALRRYPLHSNEKELIQWLKSDDFMFKGKELFTIHVLFNLLKNALYYVKTARKGNIRIWLESGDKYNKLYFRDTGLGIAPYILPRIFDRFFTDTHHGSGVGLAFCKMIMQTYGGDISCDSIEGEYAEFVLSFPVLRCSITSKYAI